MRRHYRLTSTILALAACCLSATAALAQDPDARWYRVELLVFSHEGSGAATSEAWDPRPPLAYPETFRFLRHPDREAANLEAWPGAESDISELGVQTIIVPEPPSGDEEPEDRLAAEDIPAVGDVADPNAAVAEEVEAIPLRPTPWIARPAGEREFRGKAAYMQRTGRYQTLFHESWLQPIAGEADNIPIVIDRSGDQQDWPALQGSVRLYLSRYLHIETNLWLNTDGSYIPGSWAMAPPPLGPASLIVIEPVQEPEESPVTAYSGSLFNEPAGLEQEPPDANEPRGPVSPWRHAVALTEKRRMRSEEVHYLDHPMLGLVVKLTPLSEEELEVLAVAEQAAGQGR